MSGACLLAEITECLKPIPVLKIVRDAMYLRCIGEVISSHAVPNIG